MKTLLLITALCYPIMAQEQKLPEITGQAVELPAELQAMRAARIAAKIEEARAFAEQAVANPSLIESTAKDNRLEVLTKRSNAKGILTRTSVTAELLYQIQEDLGLEAAVRAARLLTSLLPKLPKGESK